MKVMLLYEMKSHMIIALALLMTFHYGSGADCELHISSSVLLGRPIFDERLGPYNIGLDLTLTCSVSAGDCGKLTWSDEKGSLLDDSPALKLLLGPCDEGRRLQCTTEGKTAKTVQLVISDAKQNPCTTTEPQTTATATTVKTSTATSTTEASTTTRHVEGTSFASVQYVQKSNTSAHIITNNSGISYTAQLGDSVETNAVRQGTPVPATVTSGSAEEGNWTLYFIMGGVIFVGGLALATLIATSLLFKKLNQVGKSSHPTLPSPSVQENPEEPSSDENTRIGIASMTIMDINEMPSITPLIAGKPRVGGCYDPLLARGVASFADDNRDHSYYYPEELNSYHYPDISRDVREQILHHSK